MIHLFISQLNFRSPLLLILILSLSSFTHLWNPAGFPDIFYDEGIYMRRAMNVLHGQGPQESMMFYDHPYFGQLFLAGIFDIIGYPKSLNSSSDLNSIQTLYVIPRLLMGLLAVLDTFLIYKISKLRYNKNIALVASILFAVMPMSWFTRRIMLDSILLPFLLTSILFALYSKVKVDTPSGIKINSIRIKHNTKTTLVIFSGIMLGLAIFTKIPAFVCIPLIAYLVFTNSNRSLKTLIVWFMPVILIPLIWPAYSVLAGQFNYWVDTAIFQIHRQGAPFLKTVPMLFAIDPILMIFSAAGIILAAIKKDIFILLWTVPILLYYLFIGWEWAPYQLFISQIPLFCISAAVFIVKVADVIKYKKVQKVLPYIFITMIGIFGFASTISLITTNISMTQFQTLQFVSQYLYDNNYKSDEITIVSNPAYSWIFKYIYGMQNVLNQYNDFGHEPVKTDHVLLISDAESEAYDRNTKRLRTLYENSTQIFKIKGPIGNFNIETYPYTSLSDVNFEGLYDIEVRIVR